ncbi:signal peptide peptidase SppA [Hallella mizrahii]|uniref:Signal peptide peptidase SppA n=1 Tax=Hallella mizrahii TaxID=2606637 RepID=A0A7K0KF06_9BACT|nr:signal peptide peptidase SppA [Hallella mizrahii]MST84444.1 signal peptide peptidase SppA [Hallella mizrahii]
MKDFFKMTGATIVGLFVFSIVAFLIAMMTLSGMMAASEATASVQKNSVLVLKLDGSLSDHGSTSLRDELQGNTSQTLEDMLTAIKQAKTNDKVAGIYLEGGGFYADPAQVEEIYDALQDYKKSGKWLVAYADSYNAFTYYLASAADKIYLNPQGAVDWHGLGGKMEYFKPLLDKIGIKFNVFKCGKYKSATEPLVNEHMSDEARAQTTRFIQGTWDKMVTTVSKNRKISVDTLNAYADRYIGVEETKNFQKYHLVDGLLYADEMKANIKKRLGLDKDDMIPQVSASDLASTVKEDEGEEIAVYYAEGEIVDEASPQSVFNSGSMIVGKVMADDLNGLADDDDVKAVVIRVNSPGGSAYASEQIWHAIKELRKRKPVVVSMGGYAASGGYYISAPADYIVAEPTTLTGSIGIYGVSIDRSKLLTGKLGINADYVQTNRNSTMGDDMAPMTTEQQSLMQASVNHGYRLFKSRVADGRAMTMDRVEQLAQGHVYLGMDAKKLKLVDALGGLDVAVAKAAKLASLSEWHTASYPGAEDMFDQMLDLFSSSTGSYLDGQLRAVLGDDYGAYMMMRRATSMSRLQARLPYELIIK